MRSYYSELCETLRGPAAAHAPPLPSAESVIGAAFDELAAFAATARAALSAPQPAEADELAEARAGAIARARTTIVQCVATSRDLADHTLALLLPAAAGAEAVGGAEGCDGLASGSLAAPDGSADEHEKQSREGSCKQRSARCTLRAKLWRARPGPAGSASSSIGDWLCRATVLLRAEALEILGGSRALRAHAAVTLASSSAVLLTLSPLRTLWMPAGGTLHTQRVLAWAGRPLEAGLVGKHRVHGPKALLAPAGGLGVQHSWGSPRYPLKLTQEGLLGVLHRPPQALRTPYAPRT